MATTIANNEYVILENNIVISSFFGYNLPEYNEQVVNVIDVTNLKIKPKINWTYNPSNGSFSAPVVVTEPTLEQPTPLDSLKSEFIENQLADITYMGHVFNFSPSTYSNLTGYAAFAALTGHLPDNFYWLNKSNEKVPMTLEQFTGFCDLAANQVFSSFKEYIDKRNQL